MAVRLWPPLTKQKYIMSPEVISSLILSFAGILCSILFSVVFGYVPNKRKLQIERQQVKIKKLLKDVESFYTIESILVDKLAALTDQNKETLRKSVRQEVREQKNWTLSEYAKPSFFQREINL